MAFPAIIIAIAAFLSVGAAIVFVMLVIGIRRGDRAQYLPDSPGTTLDTFTRRFLGGGVYRSYREED
jgi:hypothetical protein